MNRIKLVHPTPEDITPLLKKRFRGIHSLIMHFQHVSPTDGNLKSFTVALKKYINFYLEEHDPQNTTTIWKEGLSEKEMIVTDMVEDVLAIENLCVALKDLAIWDDYEGKVERIISILKEVEAILHIRITTEFRSLLEDTSFSRFLKYESISPIRYRIGRDIRELTTFGIHPQVFRHLCDITDVDNWFRWE